MCINYTNTTNDNTFTVPLNLNFVPSRLIVRFGSSVYPNLIADSKFSYNSGNMGPNPNDNNADKGRAYIKSMSQKEAVIVFDFRQGITSGTKDHYIYSILAIE